MRRTADAIPKNQAAPLLPSISLASLRMQDFVILPGLTDPLHVDVSIERDTPLGGLPLGSLGRDGR